MPRKFGKSTFGAFAMTGKSPYATSFKTAIKGGTPCWTAITNIAKRTGKTPTTVATSLKKAGLVIGQKFNGQWIWIPTFVGRKSAQFTKTCQYHHWNWFINWCLVSGVATPRQIVTCFGTQPYFMSAAKKFFAREFTGVTTVTGVKAKRRTATKAKRRTTTKRRRTTPKVRSTTYKFSSYGRRLRRAA